MTNFASGNSLRRRLGHSGLEVSVVGLGGNTFGPPRLDEAATRRVIDVAIDLGVNLIDTANVYGQGHSEEFIGRALGHHRDNVIIATKFNLRGPGEGTVRDRIVNQADRSLRQLRTDHIDLYQLHLPEPAIPAEQILEPLSELVSEGKVRAIGVCNYASWRLAEAAHLARANKWPEFATVQNYLHLLARESESEVFPYCEAYGCSILPYHPLAGGFLTGKYQAGQAPPPGTRGAAGSPIIKTMRTAANYARLKGLELFCAEQGHTVGELAIAWLAAKPIVASVIAGVSNPEQLAANVGAGQWMLTAEQLTAIDEIVSGQPGVRSPETSPYAPGPGTPTMQRQFSMNQPDVTQLSKARKE